MSKEQQYFKTDIIYQYTIIIYCTVVVIIQCLIIVHIFMMRRYLCMYVGMYYRFSLQL